MFACMAPLLLLPLMLLLLADRAAAIVQDPPWLWASATPALDALLPYNADGRLEHNVLLVKAGAPRAFFEPVELRRIITVPADVFVRDVAANDSTIMAACAWKGLPRGYVADSSAKAGAKTKSVISWVLEYCQSVEVGFISYFAGETLDVDWIDPTTNQPNPQYRSALESGEKRTRWIGSFVGHTFEVTGKSYKQRFLVEFPSIHIVGPKPDYTTLGRTINAADKVARVRGELLRCTRVTRVFTDVGFKKIRVPRDAWAAITTYWYNNKQARAREEWLDSGFFVNWFEVNQDLVVPPPELKAKWQLMLQPVIEAWAGAKLEKTDIYGVRTYYDGAWLSNHVDREHTHAASAIINLEQVNVTEPWEVHIWDIHGKRQRVSMLPGEALLYESARCLHGRPVPLRGSEYSNIFVHYRPLGKPLWFTDKDVGREAPAIAHLFRPEDAETHDVGLVGEDAAKAFPFSGKDEL